MPFPTYPDDLPERPAPTDEGMPPPGAPSGGDLARVIEAGGDAVVVLDGGWRYAHVNGPAEELIGRTATDLVGRRVMDVFPGIEETAFWRVYQRAVREQVLISVEEFFEPLGRWFDVRAVPHGGLLYLLFRDVTERLRAEAELRRELQVRDAITANAADALFLMDAEGRITFLNPAAERTFGWRADEVVGRVLHDVLHHHRPDGTSFPFSECPLGEVMRSGRTLQGHEDLFFRRDDAPVPVLCSNAPLRSADGTITGGVLVVSDISERKAAEEELRRSAEALRLSEERYRALVDASSQIVWTNSPEGRMAGEQPGWAAFTGQSAEEYQGFGWSEAVHPDDRRPTVDEWNRCVRERAPFLWEHRVRRRDGVYRTFSIRGVPVLNGDGTIREWVGIHTDVTEKRADEAALRERSRQLRRLAEASLVINSTASLSEMFQAITDKAREVIGAHQGVVSITRGEDWSQAINAVSLSEKYQAWRDYASLPDGSGIYAVVCRENRTVRLTEAELTSHPDWRGFGAHAAQHPPMNGWLAVPLVGKDGANLGLIQLSDKYEGEFTADDEALLEQLARLASVAIENQRLLEEERAHAERQAVLNRLNTVLRSSLDPDEIERAAVAVLGEALGVDRCYMVAYHLAQDHSVISCEYRSRPDELPPLAGRHTLSDFGAVMEGLYRSPEAQVVRDVRAGAFGSDETAKMEVLGMRAFVRVPLYDGGAVAGAVGVAMADSPRSWTPEEVDLIKAAAAQVWAVVEAARAHRELEADRAKQRKIAQTLQGAMLLAPPEDGFEGLSVGTHYEPASDEALVGGDFYDALQLDPGHVALICGDGTGKGLEAARYVSESLFVLRAYLREDPAAGPAAALTRLNRYLTDGQRFDRRPESALAAVAVAVIDTRTGAASFAAGGAEPPLVVRADSGRAEAVPVSGVVLGADAETQYEAVAVVPLRPGDLVVLSTDGTTEARDRATRRFFGYEGLTAAAEGMARSRQTSPADAAQEIVARAKEFAGGSLGDDACVLVSRFTGAPRGSADGRDEPAPDVRAAGTAVASEERYRAFVENSSEGIWRFDLEEPVPVGLPEGEQIDAFYRSGFLAEANDAFARMYGFERGADLVGARVGDLLVRDDPVNVAYLSAFVRSGYRLSDAESVEKDRDGNVRYFSNTLTGIVENGRLVRAWGTQRDVTGLRASADALRASEARYRELFEGHPQPMWVFDAATLAVLAVNEAATRHYGYSREEFLSMTVAQLRPAEDLARFEAFVPNLATLPHEKMGVWRHKKKDGAIIDVEVVSSPIVYDGRRPARIVAVTDVTERLAGERARREAEERLEASVDALRASEDRYRTLFETATVGIVYQDEQAVILDANSAAQRILGLTLDQMQGRTSMDPRWHSVREDGGPLPGEEHPVPRALRSGRVERGVMGVFHPGEGTYRWIDVTAVPQSPDPQGRPRLIYALFEDITERRRAERERAASEERFRALADNIAQLAWMADASGSIFWYNRRWFEYTGTTPEEMAGGGWKSVHDPERVEQVAERFRAHVEAALPWEDTFPLRGKDGTFRWFLSRAFPIRDTSGKITLWCGTNTDVTEQREAAKKQRQFLKEMLAGFTEGRLRLCFSPEELPPPPTGSEPGPLPDERALRGLRRRVGEAVAALGLAPERAQGFATAVHEAAVNAVKYGGGGTARVCGDADKGTLQVWVEDRGPGIAEDMIHRAVEQGYTTAGFGHGMFFMQSCADRLYLFSEAGRGTTVVLEMDREAPEPAWLSR